MIIERIVKRKLEEVAQASKKVPTESLKKKIEQLPPTRDFRRALTDRTPAIVAEIKRKSPKSGWIRHNGDPVKIASWYERAGAAAISVLTEERFFGGHPHYLSDVKKTVSVPLLRKDFILDPYQVYESRVLGADGILLIAPLLRGEKLKEMMHLSMGLGLCPLVEVHDREDLSRALDEGAELIGINNRDFKTLSTDLKVTLELAPLVPPGVTIVSESGISTRGDIELLMSAGVRAFLIGEALMRAPEPHKKLRELLGEDHT